MFWDNLYGREAIDRSHAPRGNASRDALRHPCAGFGTQSVPGGIPTQSVGTIGQH